MEWKVKTNYLENMSAGIKFYEEVIKQRLETNPFPEGLANDLANVITVIEMTYSSIPQEYAPLKSNILSMRTGLKMLERIVKEKRIDDVASAQTFFEGKMNMVAISIDALSKKQSKSL